MEKAIFYKEWIKMRSLLPVMSLALIGITIYALLRIDRAVTLNGAAHLWQIMLDKEVVFIEILRFVPLIAGLLLSLAQFLPEMMHKRLKLTLHLPYPRHRMILLMAAIGLGLLIVLFALQGVLLWGYLHRLLAPELTAHALLTALPWWLAGLTLYLLCAWICMEPTRYLRGIYIVMALGLCRMFYLSDVPRSYDGMLPWLAVLLAGLFFLPLLSMHRFKEGCQD
ncbi:hypothetical protein [Alistipes sp.]|uniref:hypothetical protein n=1 Tax=Alistipes sp. TaxID=1872444 RepID=UPI0025BF0578|nr:hypothetical protein [Alistipes sp.]